VKWLVSIAAALIALNPTASLFLLPLEELAKTAP